MAQQQPHSLHLVERVHKVAVQQHLQQHETREAGLMSGKAAAARQQAADQHDTQMVNAMYSQHGMQVIAAGW